MDCHASLAMTDYKNRHCEESSTRQSILILHIATNTQHFLDVFPSQHLTIHKTSCEL